MSASRDKSIRMWDASTGMCLMTLVSYAKQDVIQFVTRAKVQIFKTVHFRIINGNMEKFCSIAPI